MSLLPLLPIKADSALSARELAQRFYGLTSNEAPTASQKRKIERDLSELSNPRWHNSPPVLKVADVYPSVYHLNDVGMVGWFMSQEMAVNLLLARPTLRVAVGDGPFGTVALEQAAEQRVNEAQTTQRLWRKVRIARSGIGRQPPKIDQKVMQVLLEAVMKNRQMRREYVSAQGHRSVKDVSIQGLVLKDDSVYVLETEGLSDLPRHLPAHRIQSAELLHKPTQEQVGFDLEAYIDADYQLSHVMNRKDGPALIELRLRIRADYEYHFRERPLTVESAETMYKDPDKEGWYRLDATLPHTFMLKQFLQSMGPGVEVLEPTVLRETLKKEALELTALYQV